MHMHVNVHARFCCVDVPVCVCVQKKPAPELNKAIDRGIRSPYDK